jgi:hypothetical protein
MTEFDRIFRHFYFRDIANELADKGNNAVAIFLDESDKWTDSYFAPGHQKTNRRLMFFAETPATWFANAAKTPAAPAKAKKTPKKATGVKSKKTSKTKTKAKKTKAKKRKTKKTKAKKSKTRTSTARKAKRTAAKKRTAKKKKKTARKKARR